MGPGVGWKLCRLSQGGGVAVNRSRSRQGASESDGERQRARATARAVLWAPPGIGPHATLAGAFFVHIFEKQAPRKRTRPQHFHALSELRAACGASGALGGPASFHQSPPPIMQRPPLARCYNRQTVERGALAAAGNHCSWPNWAGLAQLGMAGPAGHGPCQLGMVLPSWAWNRAPGRHDACPARHPCPAGAAATAGRAGIAAQMKQLAPAAANTPGARRGCR